MLSSQVGRRSAAPSPLDVPRTGDRAPATVCGARVEGWVTNASAMHAIARDLGAATTDLTRAELEADLEAAGAKGLPNPLTGFRVVEVLVDDRSPASGRSLGSVTWPAGCIPVSVLHRQVLHEADSNLKLVPGNRVNLLVRGHSARDEQMSGDAEEGVGAV